MPGACARQVSAPFSRGAALAGVVLTSGLMPPSLAAALSGAVDKEVQEYRLTMPKLQQLTALFAGLEKKR